MPDINYNAPKTTIERWAQKISFFVIFLLFAFTLKEFFALPQRIVTHFNFAGEPDGWGSRWTVWLLPIIALAIFALLNVVKKFPRHVNYPVRITEDNAQRQFILMRQFLDVLNLSIVVVFATIQIQLLRMALEKPELVPFSLLIPLVLFITFAPIMVYFYYAYRMK